MASATTAFATTTVDADPPKPLDLVVVVETIPREGEGPGEGAGPGGWGEGAGTTSDVLPFELVESVVTSMFAGVEAIGVLGEGAGKGAGACVLVTGEEVTLVVAITGGVVTGAQSVVLGHFFASGFVVVSQLELSQVTVPSVPDKPAPTPHLLSHPCGSPCTHLPVVEIQTNLQSKHKHGG